MLSSQRPFSDTIIDGILNMSPQRSRKRKSTTQTHGAEETPSSVGRGEELSGSALLEACLLGRIGFVETLLELGASVDVRSEEGDTPLILAAVQGSCTVINRLLDKGADIDARNWHGLTALMEAAFWGNAEVVKTLVQRGADVHARDSQGRTALDWAGEEGRYEIVDLLKDVKENCERDLSLGSEATVSDQAEEMPE